jgi:hypothetical protein
MKHFLNSVAVAAVLAMATPVFAQNSMGTPGPNPGGPGLTPYSTGTAPPPAPTPPASTSAMPPMHRAHAMHHAMHGKAMKKGPALAGDTTAQLNREELGRISAGNMSNPPPPPPPGH